MGIHRSDAATVATTFVDLLRWRALHQPDRRAYTFLLDGETHEVHLTYSALDLSARSIAALLQSVGVPGERVLLLYPPGLDYIAAFFACLYAGMVAVPAYPPDPARLDRTLPRLQAIAGSARPLMMLTTAPIAAIGAAFTRQAPEFQALRWLTTDTLHGVGADSWRAPELHSATLAFLQYTSGSTAAPKGVMLNHANLLHNSALIHQAFGHTPESQGMIWLPPYHDMGLIGGILQPLYGGFPVTLMSPVDFLQRPLRWLQAVSHYKATTSGGPNFAYDLCVRKITAEQRASLDLSNWRVAFNGAEPIRAETLDRFASTFAVCGFRREAFYPCYGLAEATLIVAGGHLGALSSMRVFHGADLERQRVSEADRPQAATCTLVGAGHVLAGQSVAIVDRRSLARRPEDQEGEIWVAGPSVAQGYWDNPAETEWAFRACLADADEEAFLRTGDLGFLHAGQLFITGRLKDLIIIRGRNYYPQDIELTVEQAHPALRPGCGAAFAIEVDGEERLVVVQEIDRQPQGVDYESLVRIIRQAVAEQHALQVYAVVLLKRGSIPKTSSGKLQRHVCKASFLNNELEIVGQSVIERSDALSAAPPVAEHHAFIRRALLAVRSDQERRTLLALYLQEEIARLLKLDAAHVLPEQPLNGLGLDSLMAVELANELEARLGVSVPMALILEGPSLEGLALAILAWLDAPAAEPAAPPLTPGALPTEYSLSYGQRALWFLHRLAPTSAAYNVAAAAEVLADLDVAALRGAFQALVERHPVLRTTFAAVDGEPIQRFHQHVEVALTEHDALGWDEETLRERLASEAYRPFDLEHGPLLRVELFRRAAHTHVLLLSIHHIVADLWSMAVLAHELGVFYHAEVEARPAQLPALLHYTDYSRWQGQRLAGAEGERLWDYWRQKLAGDLPVLNLPSDRPRPPLQTYRGAAVAFRIGAPLTAQLKHLGRQRGATLYMVLLAAFQTLLHRLSGQNDILVGSPVAGRERAELAGVVGYFVNPVVLRGDLSGDPIFTHYLDRVRQTVLEAFAHQSYPFPLLAERLQPRRDASRTPLFQAMFVLQQTQQFGDERLAALAIGTPWEGIQLGGLPLTALPLKQRATQFDLTLMMGEVHGELAGSFQYNSDLFDAAAIERIAEQFTTLLSGIVAAPHLPLALLPLLPAGQLRHLIVEANTTASPLPTNVCLHHLIAAQAARTPDTVAIVFDRPLQRQGDKETRRQRDKESGVRSQESEFAVLSPQSHALSASEGSVLSPQSLTYRELNERANQLAHYLRRRGVRPETIVAIGLERGPDLLVGVLGVLKAGGAYVPLDPAYPVERLTLTLADSQAAALLTQRSWRNAGLPIADAAAHDPASARVAQPQSERGIWRANVIYLDMDWPVIAQEPAAPPTSSVQPDSLAYVIYTSGSTGVPKGVAITHRSAVALVCWTGTAFRVEELARVLASTSICFDLSVFELFVPLSVGGTIVLAENALALPELPAREQVTLVNTVPSAMAELLRVYGLPASVRAVSLAGETLPGVLVEQIYALGTVQQVYNLYGPSETTTYSTGTRVTRGEPHPPIGRPIANSQVYLLDRWLQPVPQGVVGEIYLGGAGLARGYLGRPDLTAERFVPNPFATGDWGLGIGDWGTKDSPNPQSPIPNPRLYRTGDLGRYRNGADGGVGELEFLGRMDQQVKLRGYRIEPGEIEATLRQHAAVQDAIVLAREDVPGDVRLVAYIVQGSGARGQGSGVSETRRQGLPRVGTRGDKESEVRSQESGVRISAVQSPIPNPQSPIPELRDFLKEKLPAYMVPAAVVVLDALPLTPNGKLDRKALPAPEQEAGGAGEYVAPRTSAEERIAQIWAEVLGVAQVGREDNFFALGGHSLLTTRVIARVREVFRVDIPLSDFFQQPTVASLASLIEQGQAPATIAPRPRGARQLDQLVRQLEQLPESEVRKMLDEEGVSRL